MPCHNCTILSLGLCAELFCRANSTIDRKIILFSLISISFAILSRISSALVIRSGAAAIERIMMRKIILSALAVLVGISASAQCPSSNTITAHETVGGCTHPSNLTVRNASTLTISDDLTISGDLTLGANSGQRSAIITVNPGKTLTITGDLIAGYNAGVIVINGGGTVNIDGRFNSDVRTSTSFTFSNVTVTVNNVSTTQTTNDYQSNLYLLNGTHMTIVQGGYLNENQTKLEIDNSTLVLTTGDFFNDDSSTTIVSNDGAIRVMDGDFLTENQSSLTVGVGAEAGEVYINGDFNNDFRASVTVNENGKLNVTGDFNNGVNPSGSTANEGNLIINGGTLDVGNNLNNRYGSDIQLSDTGTITVVNDVVNEQNAAIDINDGTFSYGGSLSDDPSSGGVNSPSGDLSCDDGCCGSGCASLPVTLISFELKAALDHVQVTWKTASELNNDYFNVYRSADGVDFELVAWEQGHGTTSEQKTYEIKDYPSQKGTYYYQLEQVDYDGENEFFPVAQVNYNRGEQATLNIYPMPLVAGDAFYLEVPQTVEGQVVAKIYDMTGSLNQALPYVAESGRIRFETASLGLSTGVYVVQIALGNEQYSQRISVQ